MPDVREVIEMTTTQVEPDVDAWREQEQRQRRSSRGKKVGAFAVAAAIGFGVALFAIANQDDSDTGGRQVATSPSVAGAGTPGVPYTLALDTGEMTPLPDGVADGTKYSVSDDGSLIAYSWCCGSPNPSFVGNLDGSGIREITPAGVDGFGPALSPDGSLLVYQQRNGAFSELGDLVVVDLATGEETQITNLEQASYGAWFLNPGFDEVGERVIFQLPRGPDGEDTRWDLWTVPVDGSEEPRLEVADASLGTYGGPDGQLVYVDAPRGSWGHSGDGVARLMVRDADGTASLLAEIETTAEHGLEFPAWSPGGSSIAYQVDTSIYLLPVSWAASQGEALQATAGDPVLVAQGEKPAWIDDDTLLIVR